VFNTARLSLFNSVEAKQTKRHTFIRSDYA